MISFDYADNGNMILLHNMDRPMYSFERKRYKEVTNSDVIAEREYYQILYTDLLLAFFNKGLADKLKRYDGGIRKIHFFTNYPFEFNDNMLKCINVVFANVIVPFYDAYSVPVWKHFVVKRFFPKIIVHTHGNLNLDKDMDEFPLIKIDKGPRTTFKVDNNEYATFIINEKNNLVSIRTSKTYGGKYINRTKVVPYSDDITRDPDKIYSLTHECNFSVSGIKWRNYFKRNQIIYD